MLLVRKNGNIHLMGIEFEPYLKSDNSHNKINLLEGFMKYSYFSTDFVLGVSLACLTLISGMASAQPACPEECKVWADMEIPQGDTLRIVHNGDQEAIAMSLEGVTRPLLAFKNTSQSVHLFQWCSTGESSDYRRLSGAEFSQCRYYYRQVADELGIPVVLE